MSKMFLDQLFDLKRKKVFQKLSDFKKSAVLGGGTAIALQIGHRKSYDFDLFIGKPLKPLLKQLLLATFDKKNIQITNDTSNELTFFVNNDVKVTFLYFPFPSLHPLVKNLALPLFDIKDLASNKAYLLGRRAIYRDYIDFYFLLNQKISLKQIIQEAEKRFGGGFSEKLFLGQLTYFEDLNDFKIEFLSKEQPTPQEVKEFLETKVKDYLRKN